MANWYQVFAPWREIYSAFAGSLGVQRAVPFAEYLGWKFVVFPAVPLTPFSVFGYRFSVKKTRIISMLKLKFVALETELGITPA
jgi:hypothetical protein